MYLYTFIFTYTYSYILININIYIRVNMYIRIYILMDKIEKIIRIVGHSVHEKKLELKSILL